MRRLSAPLSLLAASCSAAGQSVPTWTPINDVNLYSVQGMIVHDEDGPGPIEPYLVAAGGDHDILPQLFPPGRARNTRLPVNGVGRFDGYRWSPVGAGLHGSNGYFVDAANGFVSGVLPKTSVVSLVSHGSFTRSGYANVRAFATWAELAWTSWSVETGTFQSILFDADDIGPAPSVLFTMSARMHGGPSVNYPAMWDGIALSVPDGGVRNSPASTSVFAFCEFDEDGDGPDQPRLFMGGSFSRAGTHWAHNICRWDGQRLTALGGGPGVSSGPGNTVYALEVYDDDGPGPNPPQLYALGDFTTVYDHGNALSIKDLARWDGKQWSAVPGWDQLGNAYDMAVFDDDGPGPNREALYIAGWNPKGGGKRGNGIIKWDGIEWHTLGAGLTKFQFPVSYAEELCVYDDDGPGPNPGGLYVGGAFDIAGEDWAIGFARWGIPLSEPCYADCDRAGTGYRVLDIFDFLCFQTRFAAGDPYACDADISTGPRVCDLFDFLYFQNAFAAGCP